MVDKLLITGAETMTGANLAFALAERWDVVALGASQAPRGCRGASGDWADPDELGQVVRGERPQWVVYCGRYSAASWDLSDEVEAGELALELQRVASLVEAADAVGADVTAVSTDAVFAGPRMFHAETAPPTAARAVARAALAIEGVFDQRRHLLARTCPYGWSRDGGEDCFAERIWQALVAEQPCVVDAWRHATPILAADLAELLEAAWRVRLRGVYHVTGAERTSPFRFAAELAVACGLTGRQVRLEAPQGARFGRSYVQETSLNTRAVRNALGRPLPMLREGLVRFVAQAEDGYRQQLQASDAAAWRQCEHAA